VADTGSAAATPAAVPAEGWGWRFVAEVIRAHGGEVAAQGNSGDGLTVWFRLPGAGSIR
jgi:signal transduction histidine kinase